MRHRLSWMRFCGLGPKDAVPDANTLLDFREALIAAGALEALFERLAQAITAAGCLPRGGQVLDATLVAAPRQRNRGGEKAGIAESRGFTYLPAAKLTEDDLEELVRRVLSLREGDKLPSLAVAAAVLGTVPEVLPTLTGGRHRHMATIVPDQEVRDCVQRILGARG